MSHLVILAAVLLAMPGEHDGALQIRSQPGVGVWWDGVALGEIGASGVLVIEDIPPGEYALTLRTDGFQTIERRVMLAARESTVLDLPLAPLGLTGGLPPPTAASPSAQPWRDPWVLVLLAAVLSLAFALWRARRPRPTEAVPMRSRRRSDAEWKRAQLRVAPPPPEPGSPAFLEDLKRRERDLEAGVFRPRAAPEETIIEIEAVEVHGKDE